jgi:hypothetical protein
VPANTLEFSLSPLENGDYADTKNTAKTVFSPRQTWCFHRARTVNYGKNTVHFAVPAR